MPVLKTCQYSEESIEEIKGWLYGINWPAVYIIYNTKKAYVGETLDLVRRTEQHLKEDEFKEFTDICLISDKTFNKSVILDLESYLIKYMSADKTHVLTNGNAGVVNHNYFYKDAYEDDFKEIWDKLLELDIVSSSIADIENSELFKYSPYKSLNEEQQNAAYDILKKLSNIKNGSYKSLIKVVGGAGTGKTILAVFLVKLLTDINHNKRIWNALDDAEISEYIRVLSTQITQFKRIGFVVPMNELRETMKDIFSSIDGLSSDMVLAPESVVEATTPYDLLIVDEAHRLYQRQHLPGIQMYAKFDRINERLMGELFSKSKSDYTELDWIIKSSRVQLLFYDELQSIRATDIDKDRFESICKPHLFAYYSLFSQMRCKGGNGYYEYVKKVLDSTDLGIRDYQKIENYQAKVVDDITDLFDIINEKNKQIGLCNVVCGPGWTKSEDIVIDGNSYHWSEGKKKIDEKSIISIHKSQGFDLNYAGVIFGKEVYYDSESGRIEVNKKELQDNFTKSDGNDAMRHYIINIYLTLMTRGILGTYVYACDPALREYLKMFLN